ncbi:hypothetical protein C8J57DRAFT_1251201 [Mycena rebaudengoi]|nr:hypothetical protein C8J57DRAFT_1251201 [Mycena rebaudengoi]
MTGKWVEHLYVRPAASDGGSRRDIRNVRNSEKPKLRNSAFTYPPLADAHGGRASVPDAAIRDGRKAEKKILILTCASGMANSPAVTLAGRQLVGALPQTPE